MPPSRCRRSGVKIAAVTLFAAPLGLLVALGVSFLSSPGKASHEVEWLPAAKFSSLPPDGTPVSVDVSVPTCDAWSQKPERLVGRVFLRRLPGTDRIVALRAEHNAYHIPVEYDASKQCFCSCCWTMSFDLNGQEIVKQGSQPIGHEMQAAAARVIGGMVFLRLEE